MTHERALEPRSTMSRQSSPCALASPPKTAASSDAAQLAGAEPALLRSTSASYDASTSPAMTTGASASSSALIEPSSPRSISSDATLFDYGLPPPDAAEATRERELWLVLLLSYPPWLQTRPTIDECFQAVCDKVRLWSMHLSCTVRLIGDCAHPHSSSRLWVRSRSRLVGRRHRLLAGCVPSLTRP